MADLDTTSSGIDRRTLIKRSAAAGAVAWVAPAVLATPAQAVDFIPGTTCTAKCSPIVNSNLVFAVGRAVALPCNPPPPAGDPGQQNVIIQITEFEIVGTSGASCPCGGTPDVTTGDSGEPVIGAEFIMPKPGNTEIIFEVPLNFTCEDRSGDKITVSCLTQAVSDVSGNCQSLSRRIIALQFLRPSNFPCGSPECVGQSVAS